VNIRTSDYLLARLAAPHGSLLHFAGDLETACLSRRLREISVTAPVFITGLARSGTTILLEELSRLTGFGTHRYRDFPFVMVPFAWNWFQDRFQKDLAPRERPHQDRIRITPESPEAFEEPIWQHFFSQVHAADKSHRLSADSRNGEFDSFFTDHIRKLLLVRGAGRYLSKGNYNIARIEYLANVFPDARFIVPIRHPLTNVTSLVRQHELFTEYARRDSRVPRCLAAAGHYEFGPQRVPIRLTDEAGDRIQVAWDNGDDATGYAIQWAEIYQFVNMLRTDPGLSRRILVVRHEDFCQQPRAMLTKVAWHIDHDPEEIRLRSYGHIAESKPDAKSAVDAIRTRIWQETESVATQFGYAWPEEAAPAIGESPARQIALRRSAA
jgi:hypothetical protein